jgi:hypothetical protein
VNGRIVQTELLKLQKIGQCPDEPVRIKVGRIHHVISQDVIATAYIWGVIIKKKKDFV